MSNGNSTTTKLWADWLGQLSFLNVIPIEQFRIHAGFGYYLGAPIEKDIWRRNSFDSETSPDGVRKILFDYSKYASQVPEPFRFSELDPSAHLFSIPHPTYDNRLVNTDIVRMQVEAANLFNFGLLTDKTSIIEIGAGYGGLCANLMHSRFINSYTIIDLPEILKFSMKWLVYLREQGILQCDVDRYVAKNASIVARSGIHFVESTTFSSMGTRLACDTLINTNSFCEMSVDSVLAYLGGSIDYSVLYSSNRDRQMMNTEMTCLSDILIQNHKHVWPSKADYGLLTDPPKKFVFVCSNSTDFSPPDLAVSHINGVTGPEMPGI